MDMTKRQTSIEKQAKFTNKQSIKEKNITTVIIKMHIKANSEIPKNGQIVGNKQHKLTTHFWREICMFLKSNYAHALTQKFYFQEFISRKTETGVNTWAAECGVGGCTPGARQAWL